MRINVDYSYGVLVSADIQVYICRILTKNFGFKTEDNGVIRHDFFDHKWRLELTLKELNL